MTVNALDNAFGELLHLNLLEEFRGPNLPWTRDRLAQAYERALENTIRDGAPYPEDGSLEAAILGVKSRQGTDPQSG